MTFYIPDDWVRGEMRIEVTYPGAYSVSPFLGFALWTEELSIYCRHGEKHRLLTLSSETKAIRVSFSDSDCLDFGAILGNS